MVTDSPAMSPTAVVKRNVIAVPGVKTAPGAGTRLVTKGCARTEITPASVFSPARMSTGTRLLANDAGTSIWLGSAGGETS
jgi:hypothetical protein